MLISAFHNEKLLDQSWILRRSDNKTYYMKYQFIDSDTDQEYILLITDLCLVWYEQGNFDRIRENAEELNIEVRNKETAKNLLKRIQTAFEENAKRCKIQRSSEDVKVHLSLNKQDQTNEISALSWVFDCRVLDQISEEEGFLSGPQVIFQHFIIPSQTVVNYFTENVLDELPEKLKLGRTSSMFTTNSLDYISSLFKSKNIPNAAAASTVVQEPRLATASLSPLPLSLEQERIEEEANKAAIEKEQEDLERKRMIEEYNTRQLQPKAPAPKKLKRL